MDAWLGVWVKSASGKPIVHSTRIVEALKAAAADGTLSDADVPMDDAQLDEGKMKEVLKILCACVVAGATKAKVETNEADKRALRRGLV